MQKILSLLFINLCLIVSLGCDKIKPNVNMSRVQDETAQAQANISSVADRINYILALDKVLESQVQMTTKKNPNIDKACDALDWRIKIRKEVLSNSLDLPLDFRSAYLSNIQAEEAVQIQLKAIPQGVNVLLLGLANLFEKGKIAEEIRGQWQVLLLRIQSTKGSIEMAAVSHGARIDWPTYPIVANVDPGSAIEKAGIEINWIYLGFNGQNLQGRRYYSPAVQRAMADVNHPGHGSVVLTFLTPAGIVEKSLSGAVSLSLEIVIPDE